MTVSDESLEKAIAETEAAYAEWSRACTRLGDRVNADVKAFQRASRRLDKAYDAMIRVLVRAVREKGGE